MIDDKLVYCMVIITVIKPANPTNLAIFYTFQNSAQHCEPTNGLMTYEN